MPIGQSAENPVAIRNEPDHKCCIENDYVYAYRVRLAPNQATLWHRHVEDTVYFSLAATIGQEDFPAKESIVTKIPCGAAVSRPHRHEPLVHKVTNLGAQQFHLIGAEARAAPPLARTAAMLLPGHSLELETDRFRVYRITCSATISVDYRVCGLFVVCANPDPDLSANVGALVASDIRWVEGPLTIDIAAGFEGFFAEWR